jgi:hypothetical protein
MVTVMANSERDIETGFLFASPSFWSGVARLLDLWGKFDDYNREQSGEETDRAALYSDWRIVGQDLRDSWIQFHKDEAKQPVPENNLSACHLCGKKVPPDLIQTDGRKQGR